MCSPEDLAGWGDLGFGGLQDGALSRRARTSQAGPRSGASCSSLGTRVSRRSSILAWAVGCCPRPARSSPRLGRRCAPVSGPALVVRGRRTVAGRATACSPHLPVGPGRGGARTRRASAVPRFRGAWAFLLIYGGILRFGGLERVDVLVWVSAAQFQVSCDGDSPGRFGQRRPLPPGLPRVGEHACDGDGFGRGSPGPRVLPGWRSRRRCGSATARAAVLLQGGTQPVSCA
jgi:hypothetical protein